MQLIDAAQPTHDGRAEGGEVRHKNEEVQRSPLAMKEHEQRICLHVRASLMVWATMRRDGGINALGVKMCYCSFEN